MHFEGVYKYCLEEFGEDFMEHYIGNPLGIIRKQAGKLVFYGGMTGLGFGADQYDRTACHERMLNHSKIMIDQLDSKPSFETLKEIYEIAKKDNIPRVDQFSNAITDYISDLGNSKEINLKF